MAKTRKTGLGKGLGALFAENITEDNEQTEKEKASENLENKIKITLIEPNREQPRKDFDKEQLEELANSIKQYGVLQPIIVQKKGERFEIITGERRWRASKIAGLTEIPAIVREYSKQQTVEIALIENVQRADLNPIEEAMAYQQLVNEFNLKQEEIAERVSKNRATITNMMRLLKLNAEVQNMLAYGQISSGHARALLGVEDEEKQVSLAKKIVDQQLSVREVEKIVKQMAKPKKEKKDNSDEQVDLIYHNFEDRMKSIMGTKVLINKKDRNKGRIEIEYYSEAELERLVELIESIHA